MLVIPFIVLFFLDNGLTMFEVLLLQAIFSLVIVLLEIPSGYFADIFGRKTSIVFGTIFGFLGFLVYSFSYGFTGFLISEIALGIGTTFLSGADSALIYDSLLETGQEGQYKKYQGRYLATGNFSEGIASVLGGFLAVTSLRMPFYYQAGIMLLSIPIALSLVETTRHAIDLSKGKVRTLLKVVKFALHDHKEIKWLMIYSSIIGSATLTMVWFIQPYFKVVGLPLVFFGIVWAALNISTGLFSLSAHFIENIIGKRKTIVSLILLVFLAYGLLATFQTIWAIVFILLFYFVRGINSPILLDYVNRLIPSETRATILSVRGFIGRLFFSVIGPFIGWINDWYSLPVALMVAGIAFLVLGGVSLLFLGRQRAF
ncbi:MAG: MFS transporter [Patescibacteria group bacterium]